MAIWCFLKLKFGPGKIGIKNDHDLLSSTRKVKISTLCFLHLFETSSKLSFLFHVKMSKIWQFSYSYNFTLYHSSVNFRPETNCINLLNEVVQEQLWLWPKNVPGMCGQEPCVLLLLFLLLPLLRFLFLVSFLSCISYDSLVHCYLIRNLDFEIFSVDRQTIRPTDRQV